jgi:hypothetical protein
MYGTVCTVKFQKINEKERHHATKTIRIHKTAAGRRRRADLLNSMRVIRVALRLLLLSCCPPLSLLLTLTVRHLPGLPKNLLIYILDMNRGCLKNCKIT